MAFIVEAPNSFARANFPLIPEGSHTATLIEVKNLGVVETRFGPKQRVRFTWRADDCTPPADSDWPEYRMFQTFNCSLSPQSELRKALHQILGHDPGDRFDLDKLTGTVATVIVRHNESGGRTFGNIVAVLGGTK